MCGSKPDIPEPRERRRPREPFLASEILSGRIRARARLGFRGAASPAPGILGQDPGAARGIGVQKTLLGS